MTYNPGASWSAEEPASSASRPAVDRNSLPMVSVFSGNAVFWVTFLMSILGGIVLSGINWYRLESHAKATIHIVIGVLIFIGSVVLIAVLPQSYLILLLIGLAVGLYLRSATQKDIDEDDGVTKRVDIINGWAAFGVGVLANVLALILGLVLHPVMS